MFGRDPGGDVRVYEYGCPQIPVMGLDKAIEQMRLRNRLWNALVKIDWDFRTARTELLDMASPDDTLANLRKELHEVRLKLRTHRDGRKHSASRVELKDRAEVLKAQIRATRLIARTARTQQQESERTRLKEIEASQKAKIQETRARSQLYWFNHDEVLQDFDVARKRSARSKTGLHFRRWDGSGKVTVRFQNGLPTEKVFRANRRLEIAPVPEEAWTAEVRAVRRKAARTVARIRIGSNPDRSAVWLELPIILHRPLPMEGVIRSASVIRERIGLSWRYRLIIRVRESRRPECVAAGPDVRLKLGLQRSADGLTVAEWFSANGDSGLLNIPHRDLGQFLKVEELQCVIGKLLEEIQLLLMQWAALHPVPEPLQRLFSDVVQGATAPRVLALIDGWQQLGLSNAMRLPQELLEWKKPYIHLWTWQVHLRDQLARRRRELYRRFSADLVQRSGRIFLGTEIQDSAGTADSGSGRQDRSVAAISILVTTLENRCRRDGVPLVRQLAERTQYDELNVSSHSQDHGRVIETQSH